MKQNAAKIRLGTHGEDYGSWMSNPVFTMVGALLALAVVLAALSFLVFHLAWLGVIFAIAAVLLLALLIWITWIRKQYAFGGGGMMERVHEIVLSHLDFDGEGALLEVGCGSGALSIRAALLWPKAQITGIDYWGAAYGYGQAMYGDMEAFAQELRDMGYSDVRLIDTAQEAFGSHGRAAAMMLGASRMLVGRK